MRGPLAAPAFRRLWIAGLVAETGDWGLRIALPVVVLQLTGSATATAATLVLGLLPGVLLGPVAGVLADRWDRRRLVLWAMVAQGLALLPLLAVDRAEDLLLVNLVIAAQSALAALVEPARNALLPTLVDRADVLAANGLVGLGNNLARLVGASLGGLLLGLTGLPGVLVVNVASFGLAAALLARPLRAQARPERARPERARPERAPALRAWLDGLGEIRRSAALRVALLAFGLMAVAQGVFAVLFVVFVTDRLGGGGTEVGLLRGVQAVGALAAGAALGAIVRRWRSEVVLGGSLVAFAAITALVWNGPHVTTALGWYVLLCAAMGAPGLTGISALLTVLQEHTADEVRGRVMSSAFTLFDALQAAGVLLGGALVAPLGLIAVLDAQAGFYLLAGIVVLVALRRTADRPAAAPAR
ncbi:MFS transporter [Umezawaea beigongshangensis]|uniref:MFS transporter n=1 Tax=Umezawaea beigongshangensis TaxID=2780383 RepID=UPI0018F1C912|nr:MFS transporter [Umezawaea beigongshangensis]